MLGRFLEFSVRTPDILGSYAFYTALGFSGLDGSDALGYRYGVVSDGRIAIGLHEAPVPDLTLTFVHSDLLEHARALRSAGFELDHARLGDEQLHELALRAPDQTRLRLVEARTFSPAGPFRPSQLGWFEELAIPTGDAARTASYYESLGFVRAEGEGRTTLAVDGLTLGLAKPGVPARPALCFAVPEVDEAASRLDRVGIAPRQTEWSGSGALEVVAPEGTLLLVSAGFD
jgi:hypothetical protein